MNPFPLKEECRWIMVIPLAIMVFALFLASGSGRCYQYITVESKTVDNIKIPGGKIVQKYYLEGQGKKTQVLKKTFDNSVVGDSYKW